MPKIARKYDYFDALKKLAAYACEASAMLVVISKGFNSATIYEQTKVVHQLEHNADITHHQLRYHLAREFIPPIEREDIVLLAAKLDDVIDSIELAILEMYMCNVRHLPQGAISLAEIIEKCCQTLLSAFKQLSNQKKSPRIHDLLIEVNRLEEDGDSLYIEARHKLHLSKQEALAIYQGDKVLAALEHCCNCTEAVADMMQLVIIKNS